jgi:hypothetical protein
MEAKMSTYNTILFLNKIKEGWIILSNQDDDGQYFEDRKPAKGKEVKLGDKLNTFFIDTMAKLKKKDGGVLDLNYNVSKLGRFIDQHFSFWSPLHCLPFCTGTKAHNPEKALERVVNAFNKLQLTNEDIDLLIKLAENQEPGNAGYLTQANRDWEFYKLGTEYSWFSPRFKFKKM